MGALKTILDTEISHTNSLKSLKTDIFFLRLEPPTQGVKNSEITICEYVHITKNAKKKTNKTIFFVCLHLSQDSYNYEWRQTFFFIFPCTCNILLILYLRYLSDSKNPILNHKERQCQTQHPRGQQDVCPSK